jgi:6-phosphogluconolactonase
MEFVGAPVTELRSLLTASFEELVGARLTSGESQTFSCALSGGPPSLIYLGALREAQVDWNRITVFWADERAVAPDDPESNFGLAERMLLGPLGARAPRAIRMPTDQMPLDRAAQWYDATLAAELKSGALDLAVLGVGEDGSVCSLFEGHRALSAGDQRVLAIDDAPRPPERRLSLTLPFVLQTAKVWLIAVGARKLPVLQAAIDKTSESRPLDLLMRQAKDVTVFTDQTFRRG